MSHPKEAVFFDVTIQGIAYMQNVAANSAENENNRRIVDYQQAAAAWTQMGIWQRSMGLIVPPRPIPQSRVIACNEIDPDIPTRIWIWYPEINDPVCSPCADLPAITYIVKMGPVMDAAGKFRAALVGDTIPGNVVVTMHADGSWTASNGSAGGSPILGVTGNWNKMIGPGGLPYGYERVDPPEQLKA